MFGPATPYPGQVLTHRLVMLVGTLLLLLTSQAYLTSSRFRDSVPLSIPSQPDGGTKARVEETYGKLPLSFEANSGQTDSSVKYISRGAGYSLYLTATGAVLSLNKPSAGESGGIAKQEASVGTVLRLGLVGGDPQARVAGADELPGRVSYLVGDDPSEWRTDVPTYAKVRYEGVYPGVDMVYYGNQGQLEYDFVVAPGADPGAIRLRFEGAERLEVDAKGDLLLHVPGGVVRQHRPVVYQQVGGKRQEAPSRYVLEGQGRVRFEVGRYDRSEPLVIDPVLTYSTYLGGENGDVGSGISVDSSGNAYVTGETASTNFPTTSAAYDTSYNGNQDAFVAKLTLDQEPPSGSVTINGGAVYTNSTTVSVAAPATDNSGKVTKVRVSNSPDTTGGVLTRGRTYDYHTPITWSLSDPAYGGSTANGNRSVYAQWQDAAGNWSNVESDSIFLDTARPSGTVRINNGATYTSSRSVTLALSATDPSPASAVASIRLSNNGSNWTAWETYKASRAWTLSSGDGAKTVYVQYRDRAGNVSASARDTIILDTAAPSVQAPIQSLVEGTQLGASNISVRLNWSGTDSASGVSHYQLQQSTDGGAYADRSLASPTTTSRTLSLPPSHTYRFRVRAQDRADNRSGWAYGPRFRVATHQEDSAAIQYREGSTTQQQSSWLRVSRSGAYGGYVNTSTAPGAKAILSFYGRNVGVVMPRRGDLGAVRICLDPGTAVESCATVDLSPADTGLYGPRKLVWVRNGLDRSVGHKVEITVLSGRADLDGIVVLR